MIGSLIRGVCLYIVHMRRTHIPGFILSHYTEFLTIVLGEWVGRRGIG